MPHSRRWQAPTVAAIQLRIARQAFSIYCLAKYRWLEGGNVPGRDEVPEFRRLHGGGLVIIEPRERR